VDFLLSAKSHAPLAAAVRCRSEASLLDNASGAASILWPTRVNILTQRHGVDTSAGDFRLDNQIVTKDIRGLAAMKLADINSTMIEEHLRRRLGHL
jgi:hypothetical protein